MKRERAKNESRTESTKREKDQSISREENRASEHEKTQGEREREYCVM